MPTMQTVRMVSVPEKKRMSRILVVEDSPTQAQQLSLILASEQLDVEMAASAEQGWLRFQTSDFDLVISDIVLPGMSGYELCHQVKNHSTKSDVPVILLTSLSDPMNIIQGLECGANNFITKPYEPTYLLGRVNGILENKALRSNGKLKLGAEIVFMGKKLTITSDKEQILDLLVNTFEDVVRTNQELKAREKELAEAKGQLAQYARHLEGTVRITEDKMSRAEEALVEGERRYRRLVEFSPDAIFINRENKIVFANQPCLKLFGATSAEQVVGKSVLA